MYTSMLDICILQVRKKEVEQTLYSHVEILKDFNECSQFPRVLSAWYFLDSCPHQSNFLFLRKEAPSDLSGVYFRWQLKDIGN